MGLIGPSVDFFRRSTGLDIPSPVSDFQSYDDPAFTHPYWSFACFRIPPEKVLTFVEVNGLEATQETTLLHRRDSIPTELQHVSPSEARFYKRGLSKNKLPFEVLADISGTILIFLVTPD